MKKAVLFDLDGTLVNSLYDLYDATNHMLNEFGIENRSMEEVRQFVGNGVDMLVKRAIGDADCDFNKALSCYREYYNNNLCNRTKPYEGITEALEELKCKGFKLGVVTNKPQYAAQCIVKHYFGESFDVIVGADLEKRRKKPEPDGVNFALNIMEVSSKDTVFVGDSEVDIKTAVNMNMDFIGVTWGFREKEIFRDVKYIASRSNDIVTLCCNFL